MIAFSTTNVAGRHEVGKGKPPMPPGDMPMGPDGKLTGMKSGCVLRDNIKKAMKDMGAGGMD